MNALLSRMRVSPLVAVSKPRLRCSCSTSLQLLVRRKLPTLLFPCDEITRVRLTLRLVHDALLGRRDGGTAHLKAPHQRETHLRQEIRDFSPNRHLLSLSYESVSSHSPWYYLPYWQAGRHMTRNCRYALRPLHRNQMTYSPLGEVPLVLLCCAAR